MSRGFVSPDCIVQPGPTVTVAEFMWLGPRLSLVLAASRRWSETTRLSSGQPAVRTAMTAMMTASQRNRVLPRKAAAAPPLPCNGYPRV